jgi:hypothetical protein
LRYDTIQYEDLGSAASHSFKDYVFDEEGNYSETIVTHQCTAGEFGGNPSTAHEAVETLNDCTVLAGYDPDYPFMTPENLDTYGCINNIWPCMEHICGDRYGNFNWSGDSQCAWQTWIASEIVEDIYTGGSWGAYFEFSGEPSRLENCTLTRHDLSYSYYYNGSRSYTFKPKPEYSGEDWGLGSGSATRHFAYKRKFDIILPEESNSETGGNE